MRESIRRVCVLSNDYKDQGLKLTHRIEDYMKAHGGEVSVVLTKWDFEKEEWVRPEQIPEDSQCILVIGGDGTMLQAARNSYGMGIPLLGINRGTLGFMTEVDSDHLEDSLEQLITGDYSVEERMMLEGEIERRSGEIISSAALNDIVINRAGSLQTVRFDIWLNHQLLRRYNADGCIISTPTGSTAYNLSAGGPVIEPTAKAMCMTNICPHNLFNRGVVMSGKQLITLVIPGDRQGRDQPVEVAFDGTFKVRLHTGDSIDITEAKSTTRIIRLEPTSFMETLHKKMGSV
ncbi:MAG: NAD(+)/NADH kinase [Lachnospiraceae bacterium]|nr:NAD(+)/NADH kinase [Lachnospiraceae bacterium]